MKLKWTRALFSLLICGGITLSSCSDKDEQINGVNSNNQTEKADAYLSFRMLSGLNMMLSAKATEEGDDEENAVKEVLWVLYDEADKVAYSELLSAETNGTLGSGFTGNDVASSSDRGSFIMKAKHVKAQDYRLLAVLNPTAEMKAATAVGSYLSRFDEAKTTSVDEVSKAAQNGLLTHIVMSNANGLVDVKKDLHMYETAAEAEAGVKPTVQVDRILSKVSFQMKPDSEMQYPNGGKLVKAIWKLDVTNKKSYWMRRKTFYAPVVAGNASSTNWLFEDGSQVDRSFYYAEDPNFDNFSIFRNGGSDMTPLQSEFNFESSGFITDLTTTKELSTTPTREYTLENTMTAQEQWEDVTTRILIRGNYIPAGFKDLAKTQLFQEGDSYYFIGGVAVSFQQLKAWYEDLVNDNKNYPWPTAPAGIKEAVVKAVNEGFIDLNVADGRTQSGSHDKLHFYKNGDSYYSALIRHFSDDYSSNVGLPTGQYNFGRYGIARNNIYKVTLTRVTGPGTPTIPKPEGPDDKDKKYLSTEIQVLPWVIRTQEIDI